MRIWETFLSIQGEAKEAGLPTIFVRFTGCNLRCKYSKEGFCDTPYAYKGGVEMTPPQVFKQIKKVGRKYKRVCLTGGEPVAQPYPELAELIYLLKSDGYYISIETNGSLLIKDLANLTDLFHNRSVDSFVLDYKLPSSKMEEKMILGDNLPYTRSSDQIKFVTSDEKDFKRALKIIKKFLRFKFDINDSEIPHFIFSPNWGVLDPKDLVKWVLKSGIDARVQVQLHKIIYGPTKRGV